MRVVIALGGNATLLACQLEAEALLLLTDVSAVHLDWGLPTARPLRRTAPVELRRHTFAPGSMGPKVGAACRFVEATSRLAGIGAMHDAAGILRATAGTVVSPD